jgi:hypothetical protein
MRRFEIQFALLSIAIIIYATFAPSEWFGKRNGSILTVFSEFFYSYTLSICSVVARIGNHMLVNVSTTASNTVLGYVMMSENNRKKAEAIQKCLPTPSFSALVIIFLLFHHIRSVLFFFPLPIEVHSIILFSHVNTNYRCLPNFRFLYYCRLKFASLCKHLEEDQFLACLQLVLEQTVDLMFVHVDLLEYHETKLANDHNFDVAQYFTVQEQQSHIWLMALRLWNFLSGNSGRRWEAAQIAVGRDPKSDRYTVFTISPPNI